MQSFILEFILTYFLMLVIINVSTGPKEQGMFAGIAIGSVILLEAMFAGPDQRGIDESRPIAGSCYRIRTHGGPLDLSYCTRYRSCIGDTDLEIFIFGRERLILKIYV